MRNIFDSVGRPAFELEVYCKIKNFDKLVTTVTSACQTIQCDPCTIKADEKEEFEEAVKTGLANIRSMLEEDINSVAMGYDPQNQREFDDEIS